MEQLAEDYVRIVLEIDTHEDGYVDAYYGPAAWKEESKKAPRSLQQLLNDLAQLRDRFDLLRASENPEPEVEGEGEAVAEPEPKRRRVAAPKLVEGAHQQPLGEEKEEKDLKALRMVFMDKQIVASQTFVRELLAKQSGGARLNFDEESRLLYDAVAPTHTEDDFKVQF